MQTNQVQIGFVKLKAMFNQHVNLVILGLQTASRNEFVFSYSAVLLNKIKIKIYLGIKINLHTFLFGGSVFLANILFISA